MTIYKPSELEYDEELYSKLQPRNGDFLRRFFNAHVENLEHRRIAEDGNSTKDNLCKLVAAELEDEANTYLNRYKKLKDQKVRTVPAVDYLAEHYDIDKENLDVDNRHELLLLLYEEDLIDQLEELIIRSRIKSYSAKSTYILDRKLDFDTLEQSLEQFHREWNIEREDPNVILVDKEFESENLIVLKIYQETSMQYPKTFSFREDEEDEIPAIPELTSIKYQQLKTIRFQLENKEDGTELVFTESFSRWRKTLDDFFESVFDVADFREEVEKASSPVAEDIEREIVDSIEQGEDPVERARNTIDEKREEAETRVDDLDVPDSRKQEFRDRIGTIEISGSEIVDDQSIETQEFRLIAGLEGLFNSVDIEEGFRDMLEKAESEKQSFVITISGRAVRCRHGTRHQIGEGSLHHEYMRALQILLDGE
ncbi:hypothetical protein, partial [Haloarcula mannanilytica]|uniref:hypothetical protein n=1 Tax=Haloarcula mannanilytica TaxID=2509225 RepID=UPI0010F7902D